MNSHEFRQSATEPHACFYRPTMRDFDFLRIFTKFVNLPPGPMPIFTAVQCAPGFFTEFHEFRESATGPHACFYLRTMRALYILRNSMKCAALHILTFRTHSRQL